jgi:hypothetical protein
LVISALLLLAVLPLTRAHAHNDYEQPRPLVGALSLGFCSIEADVYPVGDKLLVGHDRKDLTPRRELERMYLRPLLERMKRNRGWVYSQQVNVTLLIDIKQDGERAYALLKPLLAKFFPYSSGYGADGVRAAGLTVILSGERPIATVASEPSRLVFIDGRPDDIGKPSWLYPLISSSWGSLFTWRGDGDFYEREKLRSFVRRAHDAGQKVRFWATPDDPRVWEELYQAGVDTIGSDRQGELATFLRSH